MSAVKDRADAARRTRRHPRPWQFDYLHLRRLLDDLRPAMARLAEPGGVVLDVFCGSRPYDDLVAPVHEAQQSAFDQRTGDEADGNRR